MRFKSPKGQGKTAAERQREARERRKAALFRGELAINQLDQLCKAIRYAKTFKVELAMQVGGEHSGDTCKALAEWFMKEGRREQNIKLSRETPLDQHKKGAAVTLRTKKAAPDQPEVKQKRRKTKP